MSTVVNFPSNFVISRNTRMVHHNRFVHDEMEGGSLGVIETSNLDYVSIPCVVPYITDSEHSTLVDFLEDNAGNQILLPIDSIVYLGARVGDYSDFMTGNVWTVEFSFYGARFTL